MHKYLAGVATGIILAIPTAASAELSHWNVRGVVLHFKKRTHGDKCHQIIFEDGSGTICTREYRVRLDP